VPLPNKVYGAGGGVIRVVDCNTHVVTESIVAGGSGMGLVFDSVHKTVYCSNAGADKVQVIDGRADTLIKTIPLGQSPGALCWNQTNSRVYIADFMDNVVYVIRDTNTSVAEGNSLGRSSALFEARPNPFTSSVLIRCLHGASREAPLRIYAQTGTLVRTLAGGGPWHWDGRDDHGRPVPAGVYVLRSTREAGALLVVKSE
jgi:YVTN family beta-propeller protein